MIMNATILEVQDGGLLVRDWGTAQKVVVHTPLARQFSVRDRVCILYSGAMTRSLPPQISATHISKLSVCGC